jgi:hypothetical protein
LKKIILLLIIIVSVPLFSREKKILFLKFYSSSINSVEDEYLLDLVTRKLAGRGFAVVKPIARESVVERFHLDDLPGNPEKICAEIFQEYKVDLSVYGYLFRKKKRIHLVLYTSCRGRAPVENRLSVKDVHFASWSVELTDKVSKQIEVHMENCGK